MDDSLLEKAEQAIGKYFDIDPAVCDSEVFERVYRQAEMGLRFLQAKAYPTATL